MVQLPAFFFFTPVEVEPSRSGPLFAILLLSNCLRHPLPRVHLSQDEPAIAWLSFPYFWRSLPPWRRSPANDVYTFSPSVLSDPRPSSSLRLIASNTLNGRSILQALLSGSDSLRSSLRLVKLQGVPVNPAACPHSLSPKEQFHRLCRRL